MPDVGIKDILGFLLSFEAIASVGALAGGITGYILAYESLLFREERHKRIFGFIGFIVGVPIGFIFSQVITPLVYLGVIMIIFDIIKNPTEYLSRLNKWNKFN